MSSTIDKETVSLMENKLAQAREIFEKDVFPKYFPSDFRYTIKEENLAYFAIEFEASEQPVYFKPKAFVDYYNREKCTDDRSWLLIELIKTLSESVGNFQLDEELFPLFKRQYSLDKESLNVLHRVEERYYEVVQALVLGLKYFTFDQLFDKRFDYVPAFSKEDMDDAHKAVSALRALGFKVSSIATYAFAQKRIDQQGQCLSFEFKLPKVKKTFRISVFGNQLRSYQHLFAPSYSGEEVWYQLIKKIMAMKVDAYDAEKDPQVVSGEVSMQLFFTDKQAFLDKLASLPASISHPSLKPAFRKE